MIVVLLFKLGLWGKKQVWEKTIIWDFFVYVIFCLSKQSIGNIIEFFIDCFGILYNRYFEMKSFLILLVICKFISLVVFVSKFFFVYFKREVQFFIYKRKYCRFIFLFYKVYWEYRIEKWYVKWESKNIIEDVFFYFWFFSFLYRIQYVDRVYNIYLLINE